MALVNCLVCNGIVSSDAKACRHCGSPNFCPFALSPYSVKYRIHVNGSYTGKFFIRSNGKEYYPNTSITDDISGEAQVIYYPFTGKFDSDAFPIYEATPTQIKDIIIPKVTDRSIYIRIEVKEEVKYIERRVYKDIFGFLIDTGKKRTEVLNTYYVIEDVSFLS